MGYWGRVAQRAWHDTRPWLGLAAPRANARFIAATLVVTGAIGAALIAADRVERQAWYWAFAFALAVFVVVLLIGNFLAAPARLDRDAQALIREYTTRVEKRGTTQHEIAALQGAYAVGRELLRMKDTLTADDMKLRVDEWFSGTAAMVKRVGSRNEAFTFATAADFAAVPGGEKAPPGLLLTRLAKLKHIIDRLVDQQEGGPRVPGMKRAPDED